MALARIITRSQACSRELALDLMARGYAVEVVSPDAVPSNLADLELRIEEPSGDQLVATVSTHGPAGSFSMDFVHHLHAPTPGAPEPTPQISPPEVSHPIQWPAPGSVEVVHLSGGPSRFLTPPNFRRDLPVEASSQAPASPVPLNAHRLDVAPVSRSQTQSPQAGATPQFPLPYRQPSATLPIVPEPHLPAPPTPAPDLASANQALIVAPPVATSAVRSLAPVARPLPRPRSARSSPWQWHAALAAAVILSLAVALGFGLRAARGVSTRAFEVSAAETGAASPPDDNLLTLPALENNPPVGPRAVLSPSARTREPKSHRALKSPPVTRIGAAVVNAAIVDKILADQPVADRTIAVQEPDVRSHRETAIARDTVTYLDPRYKPAPKVQPARTATRRHSPSHGQSGGVVAANSVTYLNQTRDPKPPR